MRTWQVIMILFAVLSGWGNRSTAQEIPSPSTAVSSGRIFVSIPNTWTKVVTSAVVQTTNHPSITVTGFYDNAYNFTHDTPVYPGQTLKIVIPLVNLASTQSYSFAVRCLLFDDGTSVGSVDCVQRIVARRHKMLIALQSLQATVHDSLSHSASLSGILQTLETQHSAAQKLNIDKDSSSANAMAYAFGTSSLKSSIAAQGNQRPIFTAQFDTQIGEWQAILKNTPLLK